MEYSLEYGFLRLSQSTRQRLSIPVMVVTLGEWEAAQAGQGAQGWVPVVQRPPHHLWGTLPEARCAHFPRRRVAVCSLPAFSRSQHFRRSFLKWWSLIQ